MLSQKKWALTVHKTLESPANNLYDISFQQDHLHVHQNMQQAFQSNQPLRTTSEIKK